MTTQTSGANVPSHDPEDLGFDPDALRAMNREERDKRLRGDGNDRYLEVTGAFACFVDDPYVEPGFTREPLHDEVDVAVIGGGFGGLLAGTRLREAGIEGVRIVEKIAYIVRHCIDQGVRSAEVSEAFFEILRGWRAAGELTGLELR